MSLAPMAPEHITTFFEQRGCRVIKTASCWWYNEYRQERIYYSFPPHRLLEPHPGEISQIFHQAPKALAVRFLAPPESQGKASFLWIRQAPYNLSALSSKSRNQTRRGLERCRVRALSWDELVALGGVAHRDTLRRHGDRGTASLGLDTGLRGCPAYEAWGAFVDEQLAAYIVTLWVEDWVHILISRSITAYLKHHPNNALIFSVTQLLLERPEVSTVSYGWEPLIPIDSLEHFKLGMGFGQTPVCQRISLHPLLRPFIGRPLCQVVTRLAALRPHNRRLQQLAGLCRIVQAG